MKWPNSLTLVRHGESTFNALRAQKDESTLYQTFLKAFKKNPEAWYTKVLAQAVHHQFALGVSDYGTPLTQTGRKQAFSTGIQIGYHIPRPDVILCSPYLRTRDTLSCIGDGMGIDISKAIMDDRIREQEHGLALLYNDKKVFQTLHPDQRLLMQLLGSYWYQYPQGESVSMVRDRIRLMTDTIIREYAGKNVLVITHHLTILSTRANLERLSPEQFLALDENEKPVNCGVTMYEGKPDRGRNGQLELAFYNRKLY